MDSPCFQIKENPSIGENPFLKIRMREFIKHQKGTFNPRRHFKINSFQNLDPKSRTNSTHHHFQAKTIIYFKNTHPISMSYIHGRNMVSHKSKLGHFLLCYMRQSHTYQIGASVSTQILTWVMR